MKTKIITLLLVAILVISFRFIPESNTPRQKEKSITASESPTGGLEVEEVR